jgi:hypothetical protein
MVMATKDMSGLPISIENDRNSVGPAQVLLPANSPIATREGNAPDPGLKIQVK